MAAFGVAVVWTWQKHIIIGQLIDDPKVVADGSTPSVEAMVLTWYGNPQKQERNPVSAYGKFAETLRHLKAGQMVRIEGKTETKSRMPYGEMTVRPVKFTNVEALEVIPGERCVSFQKMFLQGVTKREPKVVTGPSGGLIANCLVATITNHKHVELTEVAAFGVAAQKLASLPVGSLVHIEGYLETNTYTGRTGDTRVLRVLHCNIVEPVSELGEYTNEIESIMGLREKEKEKRTQLRANIDRMVINGTTPRSRA